MDKTKTGKGGNGLRPGAALIIERSFSGEAELTKLLAEYLLQRKAAERAEP